MLKVGKGLFPAAAHLARTSTTGQAPGKLVTSVARMADGRFLQVASFQSVPGRTVSSSSLTTASSQVASSEALPQHKPLGSRHVAAGPAKPAQTDSKRPPALDRPYIDVTPVTVEASGPTAGQVADIMDMSVDDLHAQMYEHEPVPEAGDASDELTQQLAKLDVFMKEVATHMEHADPAEQTIAAGFFEAGADAASTDKKSMDSLEAAATIKPGSTAWQQILKKSLPTGSVIVCVHTAEELNEKATREGERPQWKPGAKVVAVRIAPYTKLYQAVTDQGGEASQLAGLKNGKPFFGSWFLMSRPSDASEARQLAAILKAWKADISHVACVVNRESIELLVGVAGPMAQGEGEPDLPGGAAQARYDPQDKEKLFAAGFFDMLRETQ